MILKDIFGSHTKAQEIVLLLNKVKEVVRQGFYDSELRLVEEFCQEEGLFLVKSKFRVLLDEKDYSNEGIRVEVSDLNGMHFIYISRSERKAYLASYYELVEDDFNLGLLLGYPGCCVKFFCKNFKKGNTDLELKSDNPWTNLSRRGEDCVLISHFPCEANCQESVLLGMRYYEVLKKVDSKSAERLINELGRF
tara:strand:+ start:2309 stop:2890 length:582 start_codon:yes stop_codon:yes gene_type:complete